jgi:hypothetical protein
MSVSFAPLDYALLALYAVALVAVGVRSAAARRRRAAPPAAAATARITWWPGGR